MAVDFSIKQVPDELARRLRKRAEANHRSLQGELMAILQQAVRQDAAADTPVVREAAPAYGPRSSRRVAAASESALIIRQAREGRTCSVADLHRYVSALGAGTPDESTAWIRQERSRR
jgi:plasmid stability protein